MEIKDSTIKTIFERLDEILSLIRVSFQDIYFMGYKDGYKDALKEVSKKPLTKVDDKKGG